jgi:hypothetical protein
MDRAIRLGFVKTSEFRGGGGRGGVEPPPPRCAIDTVWIYVVLFPGSSLISLFVLPLM